MLTLIAAAQRGWSLDSHDARTALLQSEGIDRCFRLRLNCGDEAPPGMNPLGHVVRALGSIYGTNTPVAAFTCTSRNSCLPLVSKRALLNQASTTCTIPLDVAS